MEIDVASRLDYIQMGGLCMTNGYIGKILEVDLNSGKLNEIPIDENTVRKFTKRNNKF